jgi:NAD(P)-dependent dehydrogenase (short-subunit alcohol dehydrogenase family)
MDPGARTALLCAGDTPVVRAIVRELRRARVRLLLHTFPGGSGAMAAVERPSRGAVTEPIRIEGDARSPAGAARIVDAAWQVAGRLDAMILQPRCEAPAGDLHAAGEAWEAFLASRLEWPFFLAREAARRMEPKGGRLIFIAEYGAARRTGELAAGVATAGLVTMARALAKALPRTVAVSTLLVQRPDGREHDGGETSAEVGRAVRFLLAAGAKPMIVEIGSPSGFDAA